MPGGAIRPSTEQRHGAQALRHGQLGYDTAGLHAGASRSARANGLAMGWVTIQILYRGRKAATRRCDTIAARATISCAHVTRLVVRAAWGFYSMIQFLYRDRGAATRRYSARMRVARRQGAPATQSEGGYDTAPSAPQQGPVRAAWAQCARSLGSLGVLTMHPTQF